MIPQTDQIEDIIQMVQYSYSTTSIHQLYIVRFFSFVLFSGGLGGLTWSPLHHCCKTGRELKYWWAEPWINSLTCYSLSVPAVTVLQSCYWANDVEGTIKSETMSKFKSHLLLKRQQSQLEPVLWF